jgi:hypothetical protein
LFTEFKINTSRPEVGIPVQVQDVQDAHG